MLIVIHSTSKGLRINQQVFADFTKPNVIWKTNLVTLILYGTSTQKTLLRRQERNQKFAPIKTSTAVTQRPLANARASQK